MDLMSNPRLINYLIIVVFSVAFAVWTYHGKYWDSLYWFGSIVITIAVTFRDG